jgi:hypothetical protein
VNVRAAHIILALLTFLACSLAIGEETKREPSTELNRIVRQVQDGTITKIEILALPKSVESRANITPDRLRKIGSQTVIGNLARERNDVLKALKNTKAIEFSRDCDLRRGIIFYSQSSTPLTIYYDQFNQGLVNGVKAKFSGSLLNWVESHVPRDSR